MNVVLLFLIITVTASSCLEQSNKATAGQPTISNGKKRYQLVESTVEWLEAFVSCLRNNTRLASIDNMEEFEEIITLIHDKGRHSSGYWTSAVDIGSEGNFIWASTGNRLSVTSNMWKKNEPDNFENKEHCVNIKYEDQYTYGLNDSRCTAVKYYFICEYHD